MNRAGKQWMRDKRQPKKADAKGEAAVKDHDEKPKRGLRFSYEQLAQARAAGARPQLPLATDFFAPAKVPDSVIPPGRKTKMAMDSFPGLDWAGGQLGPSQVAALAAYDYGVTFMGYPTLSLLAQIPEYRNISEVIATEMTRKWIRFHSKADGEREAQSLDKVKDAAKNLDKDNELRPDGEKKSAEEDLELLMALSEYADERNKTDDKRKPKPKQAGDFVKPKDDEDLQDERDAGEEDTDEEQQFNEEGEPDEAQEVGSEEEGDPGQEDDKSEKIRELEDAFDRLGVRDIFTQVALNDGFFGRAHIFVDLDGEYDDPDVRDEFKTDIGDGRGEGSRAKISPEHPIKRLVCVEPVWAYPANYNADNPLKPDWYTPVTWYVQQQEVHRSRFLTFVGRPVPDLLKPAFAFGGLSLTQMAKPTVDNWLRTRASVGAIINSFSIFVLATNLNQELAAGGNFLGQRATGFNSTRDNSGLLVIDKDLEDFSNIAAPLSTLDVLQAQSQEHMASVSRIPIAKLLGIQPAGLNADSDGIIRLFYDTTSAHQERFFRPNLMTIFWMVQLSIWGEVDDDITLSFEPLWELDELQQAQRRKADADTAKVLIDAGVLDPEEDRQRLADDPDSPYRDISPSEVPEPPEPEMPPGFGGALGAGGPGGPRPPGPPQAPGAAPPGPPAGKGGPPAKAQGDEAWKGEGASVTSLTSGKDRKSKR